MKLLVDESNLVRLVDPHDFKSFKVVIEGEKDASRIEALADLVTEAGSEHVWINKRVLADMLPRRPEVSAGFETMIEAARKYGWVNDKTQSVRAHIEWAGPNSDRE